MQFKRMFTTDAYRGTRGYLRTQKIYEILRTVLYFAISLSLFIAGWVSTGSRENLLTIVAVLGCLPACKSLVEMFNADGDGVQGAGEAEIGRAHV